MCFQYKRYEENSESFVSQSGYHFFQNFLGIEISIYQVINYSVNWMMMRTKYLKPFSSPREGFFFLISTNLLSTDFFILGKENNQKEITQKLSDS